MKIQRILVIGATGMLGKPVVEAFYKSGFQVTALSRNPEKIKGYFPPEITIVKGDLSQPDSIHKALEGQHAVHLNLSVLRNETKNEFHTEGEGLLNLLKIARQHNIKRISYLSSLVQFYSASSWWVLSLKQNAVTMIKNSDIPYFIYYPSSFMESIYYQYRMNGFLLNLGKSHYPQHWIAAADYAKQVAVSYELGFTESMDFIVQGPEKLLTHNALNRFATAYKKQKLRVVNLPLWPAKIAGLVITEASYGSNIIEAVNNYPEKFQADETWKLLGKPEMRIEDYANSLNK